MQGCGGDGNPRLLPPAMPVAVDPGPGSLSESLASVINDARTLVADLGLRPYRMLSVRVHWSGGEIGRGDVTRIWERELLPRPMIRPKVNREMRDGGVVERGVVEVTGINPNLTEDQVMDLFHRVKLGPSDDGFIEIVTDARDGKSERRPYTVDEIPVRRPEQFDWRVVLTQLAHGRERSGAVDYPAKRRF